jgi:hypothetical protein
MHRTFLPIALLSASLLSACMSAPTGGSSKPSLWSEGGVSANLVLGDAKDVSFGRAQTSFMNINGTSQYAKQPMRFTASLGNSEAAQAVKAKGQPLYIYAATKLLMETVDKGKPGVKTGGVSLEGTACEGYRFVLHPGNNYSVDIYAEPKIRIRSTTRADTIIGRYSSDWAATRVEAFSDVIAIRSKPFMVVEYGDRYINAVNYGPAVAVTRDFDKACTLKQSKEAFKSKGNRKNRSGNIVQSAPRAPR